MVREYFKNTTCEYQIQYAIHTPLNGKKQMYCFFTLEWDSRTMNLKSYLFIQFITIL